MVMGRENIFNREREREGEGEGKGRERGKEYVNTCNAP